MIRLGVNIDHVATLRNARGGWHPDPVAAAKMAAEAGADGITAHLREDRRHIREIDIKRLKKEVNLPLNLEMAASPDMLDFALDIRPHACCLVPERRQELTTEGGLDVVTLQDSLAMTVRELAVHGIRVSLFINAIPAQVEAAKAVGAHIVEFHTGRYCELPEDKRTHELQLIKEAVRYAHDLGLECHAGHGLNYDTVTDIAAIPHIVELNIGHFLIGQAVFDGLDHAVRKMKKLMLGARG